MSLLTPCTRKNPLPSLPPYKFITGSRIAILALSALALLIGAGCRKSEKKAVPAVSYTRIDPATAGTIEGVIRFAGKAPPRIQIDMAQDPVCSLSSPNYSEEYVVNDGKMANVFVYVKDGLGDRIYAAPATPVVIDQKGCRYVPHVIGVMAGQPVAFHTGDPTMHNINVQSKASGNPSFDMSQAPNSAPVRHTFKYPEKMIPVRCNNHPWMQAYINVASNPFFAVSDDQGHFVIQGLPPGTYTLVADQEKLGTQQQTITVASHQTAKADFSFGK